MTVPVLDRRRGDRGRHEIAADLAATSAERDRDRILPEARARAALGLRPARGHRPGEPRRRRPVRRDAGRGLPDPRRRRPERRAGPAQPLRLRQRDAPPGHARPAALLLRRGAGRQAVRQRAVRDRHPARARHPHHADARPGSGRWTLNGTKGYSTGALFADWIPVLARQDTLAAPGTGPLHVAWVERHAPGVTVTDDWDGMGQRTTASGTVELRRRRRRRRPDHALPPHLRGSADLRRLRPGAARGARRRHRPRRAARRGRLRAYVVAPLPRRRGRARRRRPARRAGAGPDGGRRTRRRGAAARGRPGRRRRRRRPHRRRRPRAASLAVAAVRAYSARVAVDVVEPALRGRRHPLGARLAQPQPALAQRAHPHAARPGGLEGPAPRAATSSTAPRRPTTDSSDQKGLP